MNVFYCPVAEGSEVILSPEESVHCIRVLRMGRGDKVQVIDGSGGYFGAVILEPDPKRCRIQILEPIAHDKERKTRIRMAIAPTKSMDRFEWFIEKAVEIGIDAITPLLCDRSERRMLKTDRLQKLILSTMKQAIIPYRPTLNELTPFKNFISGTGDPTVNRFIASCEDRGRKKLKDIYSAGLDATILIGPEGDFSPGEIALAVQHGFAPVSLGPNRLRTETAGIVACCMLNLLAEEEGDG